MVSAAEMRDIKNKVHVNTALKDLPFSKRKKNLRIFIRKIKLMLARNFLSLDKVGSNTIYDSSFTSKKIDLYSSFCHP